MERIFAKKTNNTKFPMKKTILILSILALVASGCNFGKQQSVEESNEIVVEQEEVIFGSDEAESKNSAKQFNFYSSNWYDFKALWAERQFNFLFMFPKTMNIWKEVIVTRNMKIKFN